MRKLFSFLGVLAVVAAVAWGCTYHPPIPEVSVKDGVTTVTRTVFLQDYLILNLIGGLCALAAVAVIVAKSFGVPIPVKSFWTLILCSIGSWVLRAVMHRLTADVDKYLWIVEVLGMIAIVAAGAAFAYGHKAWLERGLNVDVDRDGRVG